MGQCIAWSVSTRARCKGEALDESGLCRTHKKARSWDHHLNPPLYALPVPPSEADEVIRFLRKTAIGVKECKRAIEAGNLDPKTHYPWMRGRLDLLLKDLRAMRDKLEQEGKG